MLLCVGVSHVTLHVLCFPRMGLISRPHELEGDEVSVFRPDCPALALCWFPGDGRGALSPRGGAGIVALVFPVAEASEN